MSEEKKVLTTAFGIPVGDDQNSMRASPRGPVLMQDVHLLEKMAHFDRECIPERVVHAKGTGPSVTSRWGPMTNYTKAKFLRDRARKRPSSSGSPQSPVAEDLRTR